MADSADRPICDRCGKRPARKGLGPDKKPYRACSRCANGKVGDPNPNRGQEHPFGSPDGPLKICIAMSKTTGIRCKAPAVASSPDQKCRMHGGVALVGAQVNNFRTGRHSKYLPADLDKIYTEALANPDLLEMADHIALLEARIQDVLKRASGGEPIPRWVDVRHAFDDLATVVLAGEQNLISAQLDRMYKLLEGGEKWDTTWEQVTGTMEQLRKMTDTEVKRKKELNQMVAVERVVALMAAVGQAVKRNVKNPDEINAVYAELVILYGSNSVPGSPNRLRVGATPDIIDAEPA